MRPDEQPAADLRRITGLGTGVADALSEATNGTDGLVVATSGIGNGVIVALGEDVDGADGLVVLDSSGNAAVPAEIRVGSNQLALRQHPEAAFQLQATAHLTTLSGATICSGGVAIGTNGITSYAPGVGN